VVHTCRLASNPPCPPGLIGLNWKRCRAVSSIRVSSNRDRQQCELIFGASNKPFKVLILLPPRLLPEVVSKQKFSSQSWDAKRPLHPPSRLFARALTQTNPLGKETQLSLPSRRIESSISIFELNPMGPHLRE
jgi:hypothetical protein